MSNGGPKAFGNIFNVTNKTNDRMPDARGNFHVTEEMIQAMINAPRDEQGRVTLDFSAWHKTGPKAGRYLSGNLQIGQPQEGYGAGKPPAKNNQDNDVPF